VPHRQRMSAMTTVFANAVSNRETTSISLYMATAQCNNSPGRVFPSHLAHFSGVRIRRPRLLPDSRLTRTCPLLHGLNLADSIRRSVLTLRLAEETDRKRGRRLK
jgi:hypothetical protein